MELKDLFLEKLQELASAEQLLIANLPDLIMASSNPELHSVFAVHLRQTEVQSTRIAETFATLKVKTSTRPCRSMGALIAEASQASVQRSPGQIRDLVILDIALRIEHAEIAAYLSILALAESLDYGAAFKLLTQNLKEEQQTAEHLLRINLHLLEQAPQARSA